MKSSETARAQRGRRLRHGGLLLALGMLSAGCSESTPRLIPGARVAQRLVPLPVEADGQSRLTAAPVPPYFEVLTVDRASYPAATMASANSELRWPVDLPAGSSLRFGYLLAETPAPPPDVRLAVRFDTGDGAPLTLWERAFDAAGGVGVLGQEELPIDRRGSGELVFSSSCDTGDAAVVSWVAPKLLHAPAEEPPPNVIVICVDTLRADRLAAFGGLGGVMPFMDARLESAVRFEHGYANSCWSLPSMATLFTGRLPSEHNAGRRSDQGASDVQTEYNARPVEGGIELVINHRTWRFQTLHDSVTTLNEWLGAHGYLTAAIHANGYINPPTRALKGADSATYYRSLDAADGTDRAIRFVQANQDTPFYLFLHYIDPHQWGVELLKELEREGVPEHGPEEQERVLASYDELCGYTDEHLERFFLDLEARGALENSVVFFVSDHGERFYERDVRGSHGGCQLESVIRVPFAVWAPGLEAASIPWRVSLMDVAPTIVELLGRAPEPSFTGTSLVRLVDGDEAGHRTVISEFVLWSPEESTILVDDWKLLVHADGEEELFELTETPADTHDQLAEQPERARRMARALNARQEAGLLQFERLVYDTAQLDESTAESLRDLGYIGED